MPDLVSEHALQLRVGAQPVQQSAVDVDVAAGVGEGVDRVVVDDEVVYRSPRWVQRNKNPAMRVSRRRPLGASRQWRSRSRRMSLPCLCSSSGVIRIRR
jgi:hypothetical protein